MSGCETSVDDRVAQIGDEARALVKGASEVFEYLWPNDDVPRVISQLARRLDEEGTDAIIRLQESAARGGAEWAISLMLSWYPAADPEALAAGFRTCTSYEELHQFKGVRSTAYT